MTIDAADFNILSGRLLAIAAEMGDVIQRAAYSTIVRESKDYSTCITDRDGRMVAQSELIAMHMNSLASAMSYAAEQIDLDELRPGEALITNNPYQNGQHLNDIIIMLPVFHGGERVAFAGTVCHHLEVGGSVAGSNVNATELFHEGLILPLMRVDMARDLEDGPVFQILAENVRLPSIVVGDFRAQLSALRRGHDLLVESFDRYGAARMHAAMAGLQTYAERMMRAAIQAIPDGRYDGEDTFDGRHLGEPPVTVRATVIVDGDRATVDLTRTDDQIAWPMNAPVASTHAAVYTLFAALLGPGVPTNDGTFRPIRVVTRKGSVLDPIRPAPVRARMTSVYRAFGAAKRALAQAIPERLSASGNDSSNLVTLSHRGPDGYRMFTESMSGGNGGSVHGDGEESVSQSLSNTSNAPVEALEMKFPFVRIVRYGLASDTAGAGRFRGGLGVSREYEILEDDVLMSTNGDRHDSAPWGVAGGRPATRSSLVLLRDGERTALEAASNVRLRRGDHVTLTLCGGGGHGDPALRDPGSIRADVRSGRISAAAALADYGVAADARDAAGPAGTADPISPQGVSR
ncbi:MAG: hydantoinase B/oxoprolinase family protein [Lautropia sp.]